MNPGPHHPATLSEKLAGPPTLRDWNPGAAVSALAAEEIGVWLIDLDAGLLSPSQIDFAEPGAELDVLDAGERGARSPVCAGAGSAAVRPLPKSPARNPGRVAWRARLGRFGSEPSDEVSPS